MAKETIRNFFVLMSGIAFIIAFLMFGILLRSSIGTKSAPPTKITPESKPITNFKIDIPSSVPVRERAFGVIRSTGLKGIEGEKTRLGLALSNYELELPVDLPALLGGSKVLHLTFEDENFDYAKFLGNCVEIGYVPLGQDELLKPKDIKSYSIYPVVVWEINILERSKCKIYKGIAPTKEQVTFTGILERFERPAPDIGYDYKLVLDTPYMDPENAAGFELKVYYLIVVPNSVEVRDQIEKNMDKNVTLKGNYEWGFAETKHFLATKVL